MATDTLTASPEAPRSRPGRHTMGAATGTTTATDFREIPAEGCHLLAVAAGVEAATACREAADLEDAVRRLLGESIETGTTGSTAYLCEFALEVARALRRATAEGNLA